MHKNLQDLSTMIKLTTIFSVPLLIIIVLILHNIFKNNKWRNFSLSFNFNKEFAKTSLAVFAFVTVGAISVYLSTKDDWSEFENKKFLQTLLMSLTTLQILNFLLRKKILSLFMTKANGR